MSDIAQLSFDYQIIMQAESIEEVEMFERDSKELYLE